MFNADNIAKTARKLGVKVALVKERYWIDPALMRVTIAEPVSLMAFDWLRGYPDTMFKSHQTILGLWSAFWFGDEKFYIGLIRGLYNFEHYKDKVNLYRTTNKDAYDLGFSVRLDLIGMGVLSETVPSSSIEIHTN